MQKNLLSAYLGKHSTMMTHQTIYHYVTATSRYENMQYQCCGNSGIVLSRLSLGLWQNFGEVDIPDHY